MELPATWTKANPGDSLFHLGSLCARQGRLDEALKYIRRALRQNPNFAAAHYQLGVVLGMLDRTKEAIRCYRRAIALDPSLVEAHNNLANAIQKVGRQKEAIAHYEQAISRKPDYVEAHYNLGCVLRSLDRLPEALAQFEHVRALRPEFAEAHASAAEVYTWLGRLEEAQGAIKTAIRLAPMKPGFYRSLARLIKFTEADPHIATLEKLARTPESLKPHDRIDLHFALARAYADLSQYERSFGQLISGNATKRRQIAYDEAQTLARMERIRGLFTREAMQTRRVPADNSSGPIFIVGMPRSGSTLVEQILASHPELFGAGETDEFERAVAKLPAPVGGGPGYPASELPTDREMRRLGAAFLVGASASAPPARRIVEKTLRNILFVGLIHLALPNARILHVRRDPLDTCFSCFAMIFEGDFPYAYDLQELGRYYRAYETLMEHWRSVLPKGAMLDIDYEDLVGDFEPQARRILAHCDLKWDDACRSFHASPRPVRTASAAQVRRPIYRTSVGSSRPYVEMLAPLVEALRPPS